ncbi:MAG: phosphomannomutase/phosphoglucomutase [Anaerolineae bacterium]|nr:phosphomannomutase/phosphoglucomutase [Anaerolineae bacterium]
MTTVDPNVFRKYDIRGVATGDDPQITPALALLVGKAYGTYMRRHFGTTKAYVGGDNRPTTPALKAAMCKGIAAVGIQVIDIGEVLTPTVYYAASTLGESGGGVMITGSHLEQQYNGIKMSKGSQCLAGPEIQDLLRMIQADDFDGGATVTEDRSIVGAHFEKIKSMVKMGKRKIKLVLDAGNALAGVYMPDVYRALGFEVVCLYCDPDPAFPNHLPNPEQPELVEDLRKAVLAHRADIGIGFDGDSDRCGIIDNKGTHISSDRTTALLALDLLKRHPGAKIVFDVKSSQAVVDAVNAAGGQASFWRTGHSIMKARIKEIGAILGGEVSGHIFLGENYYGFDDAPLVSLKILEILSNSDKTLAELFEAVPKLPATPEIIMHAPDDKKAAIIESVSKKLAAQYQVIDIDGARAIFEHGWGLVRMSNTHPAITMRFEADTHELLLDYMNIIKGFLNAYPEIDQSEFETAIQRVKAEMKG